MNRMRTVPPQTPRPYPPEVVASPRVAALAAALAAGEAGALAAFWAEVAAVGTPLVEPLPDDPGYCIVTFVWRDDGTAEGVLLSANKFTDPSCFAESLLERLPGTDLWHRSYRMRADWRAGYQLAPLRAATAEAAPAAPDPARARQLARAAAVLSPERLAARERWMAFMRHAVADPLNRQVTEGGSRSAQSIVALPDAPPQPWWDRRAETPVGQLTAQRVVSAALGNSREVWLYTPAGYDPVAGPYPLLVLLDGDTWAERSPIAPTLDNLIATGAIPPLVAVLPSAIDAETRTRELACSEAFLTFLTAELLPWASAQWAITADPAQTTIAGQSLGGLTAAFAGLLAPERFGNVLSQSGSFWWMGGSPFDEDAEWLTRQYAVSPRVPVRFYAEVGLQEWVLLPPTRHFRNVLDAHGYDLTYREYNGGHDLVCWRGGLADGLIALLGSRES